MQFPSKRQSQLDRCFWIYSEQITIQIQVPARLAHLSYLDVSSRIFEHLYFCKKKQKNFYRKNACDPSDSLTMTPNASAEQPRLTLVQQSTQNGL